MQTALGKPARYIANLEELAHKPEASEKEFKP